MPKISVIVPVFNDSKYLSQCISSIANQTLKDIEIILINDGSTDSKTLRILDKASEQYKNLQIITQENRGVGAARNVGLENSSGEFVKFVDADDYLQLDILEKMFTVAKETNVSLVRGNYQTIIGPIKTVDMCNWTGQTTKGIVDVRENKDIIVTETPGIGNKLIKRTLFADLRFPEKGRWEDLGVVPIIVTASGSFYDMNEPVYNYRANMNTTITDFIKTNPHTLDIIRRCEDLKLGMEQRGFGDEYQSQIESLYILHTLFRVENAMTWVNFPKNKKRVVVSSLCGILDAKYPNWKENAMVLNYRGVNKVFDVDMGRLDSFIDEKYRTSNIEEAKDNIRRSFK